MIPQERRAWLLERRKGIGASDLWKLLNAPWALWCEKTGLVPVDDGMSTRQKFGLRMEPILAEMLSEETGLDAIARQIPVRHPWHEWATATLDGLVFTDPDERAQWAESWAGQDLGVEGFIHAGFEAKTDARYRWDEIPENYQAQGQWGMFVTGLERWYFGVLHGGLQFKVYVLERHEGEIDFLVDEASRFWHDHVLANVAPPVDGSTYTADMIARRWPEHAPGTATPLDAWAAEIRRRDEIKAVLADAEKALAPIENTIRVAIAGNELGTVDGVPELSYRLTTRKPQPAKPETSFRVLRKASKKDRKTYADQ